jgi:poly-gamma-glutamate synthesis protein (capsule biosynthesis protein)
MGAKIRIINLETSVTDRGTPWEHKEIQYRVHPGNVDVLKAMKVSCASLGNNHVLDWGYIGLTDTLNTLKAANIMAPGAGETLEEAQKPGIIPISDGRRVLVFGFGDNSSGIFRNWAASSTRGGVNYIDLASAEGVTEVKRQISLHRKDGDIVVASIHQGGNWGYRVDPDFKKFAFALVDDAKVDMVHCHSSHHFKGISVYKSKLIIWGCGDFITDYEGISGHESYRGDLGFMYFPKLDSVTGNLKSLTLTPTLNRHFTINNPSVEDREWMFQKMKEECAKFSTTLIKNDDAHFSLKWE